VTRAMDPRTLRYGFVCNLANYLYQRAVPLRRLGYHVDVVLHPFDTFVMSQPGWEELDAELYSPQRDVDALTADGFTLPSVADVVRLPVLEQQVRIAGVATDPLEIQELLDRHPSLRLEDVVRFASYLCHLPTLDHLLRYDALLSSQAPYLAYLSGRPYLAAQNGGDLWLDCSRDDARGQLQRVAFGSATAIIASNPWTFAHARRYGMRNAIYLPYMLDDEVFAPGPSRARADWEARTGGTFFVLSTARLDDRYKGSDVALQGFHAFADQHPGARLVQLAWGDDLDAHLSELEAWGIRDRVLVLPLAGKARIRDYLRGADVLLDQFALGAYGGTALEAMGCGLPVVMRLELDQYTALLPAGAPPILQAETPAEIAERLSELAASAAVRTDAGNAARAWFVDAHGASRWAERYGQLLAATALGYRPPHDRSPLGAPRTDAELAYERAGLDSAPPFPS
jgi:glycosyltransferase involved in cell wall biosynthesis